MDDTIYRQAAIDAICKVCSIVEDYHKCDGYPETSTWCDEMVALRTLPSAQSEPGCQWIPCAERLPEEKRRYLVYYTNGGTTTEIRTAAYYPGGWAEWDLDGARGIPLVFAWMPLPGYIDKRGD